MILACYPCTAKTVVSVEHQNTADHGAIVRTFWCHMNTMVHWQHLIMLSECYGNIFEVFSQNFSVTRILSVQTTPIARCQYQWCYQYTLNGVKWTLHFSLQCIQVCMSATMSQLLIYENTKPAYGDIQWLANYATTENYHHAFIK